MARIEALDELRRLLYSDNGHFEADEVLCALLADLGCVDVVLAWRDIPKWYKGDTC